MMTKKITSKKRNLPPGSHHQFSILNSQFLIIFCLLFLFLSISAAPRVSWATPEIDVTDSIAPPSNDLRMPFGFINQGGSSSAQTVTISNVGILDLNVTNITLTGDTSHFSFALGDGTGGTCGPLTRTLSGGANCTVSVTFSPTNTGSRNASINISSNDSDEATVTVALSGTGSSGAGTNISVVDYQGGAHSSLAVHSDNGFPHIAYHDPKSGELRYSYWDGNQWVRGVVETGGTAGGIVGEFASLKLVGNLPRISYYHNETIETAIGPDYSGTSTPEKGKYGKIMVGDLKYAYCNAYPCLKPSDWTIVTVAGVTVAGFNADYMGGYSSLDFDSSGNPRIVYTDYSHHNLPLDLFNEDAPGGHPNPEYFNASRKKIELKIAYCDANCNLTASWKTKIIDADGGRSASMAIDTKGTIPDASDDIVHVSYYAPGAQMTRYAELSTISTLYDSINRVDIQADNSAGALWRDTSLALNASGKPRIAYQVQTSSGDTQYGKTQVLYSTHHTNQPATDTSPDPTYILYFSLYYAYCDTDCGTVSGNWTKQEVDNTSHYTGYQPSIAIDRDSGSPDFGYARISYHYMGNYSGNDYNRINPERDLRYVACGNLACTGASPGNIDTGGIFDGIFYVNTGLYSSLVLDTSEKPMISYYDFTNNQLKLYATDAYTGGTTVGGYAGDTSGGGAGLQDGDTFIFVFSGETTSCTIDKNNIDTVLSLSDSHSWLCPDGSGSVDVAWSSATNTNDTLKVTVHAGNDGCMATVATGDTVYLDGSCIKDASGNGIINGVGIGGSVDESLPYGAVAWWKMDEGTTWTAYDSIGGHDASLKNFTLWDKGISGTGIKFDGIDDYLAIQGAADPAGLDISGPGISMEAWLKPDATGTGYTVLNKRNSYKMASNGQCAIETEDAGNWAWYGSQGLIRPQQNVFRHVVCTYDSATGEQRVYLDGILDYTLTGFSKNVKPSNYPPRIGRMESKNYFSGAQTGKTHLAGGAYRVSEFQAGSAYWGSNYYNGIVDEVLIYNRGITSAEVRERFNKYTTQVEKADANDTSTGGLGTQTGDTVTLKFTNETNAPLIDAANIDTVLTLFEVDYHPSADARPIDTTYAVAHWRFDNTSGGVIDSVGNFDGSVSGGATRDPDGVYSGAMSFDGDDYVDMDKNGDSRLIHADATNGLTLEAWVYRTASGLYHGIVDKYNPSNNIIDREYRLGIESNNQLKFWLGYSDGDKAVTLNSGAIVPANQWVHVAATWDGTTMKVYINGLEKNSSIPYITHVNDGSTRLRIGQYYDDDKENSGTEASYGFIGKIDEVVIYKRALTKAEIMDRYNTALTTHTWLDSSGQINNAVWSTQSHTNDTLIISLNNSTSSLVVRSGNLLTFDGVTIKDRFGVGVTNTTRVRGSFDFNGMAAYWTFEDKAGTTTEDIVGQYNDGILTKGPVWTSSGRFNRGMTFDGTDDYIDVVNSQYLNPSAISVEAWARSDDTAWDDNGAMVSKRDAYVLDMTSGSKQVMFSVFVVGTGWQTASYIPESTVDITEWHHYVGTYDGTDIKFYFDGSLKATTNYPGTLTTTDTGNLYFGREDGLSDYMKGQMDEVVIYSHALTPSEVRIRYGSWLKTARAKDNSGGGPGLQANDQVVITFTGSTNAAVIDKTNITTSLALSNSHTWLDGNDDIGTSVWSKATYTNDTLTVTLSDGGGLSLSVVDIGDTITLNGVIKDTLGRPILDSTTIGGSFGTNLPATPNAYWSFDEGSGSWAYDAFGDNHGNLSTPTNFWKTENLSDTSSAKGLYFDYADNYVSVPDHADFDLDSYTLDTWVRIPENTRIDVDSGIRHIVSQDDGAGNYWQMRLNNNILELCDNRISPMCVNAGLALDDGNWHHLAAVHDDDNDKVGLYVDGQEYMTTATGGGGAHNISAGVEIGRRYDGSNNDRFFRGMMDELVVYNSALTASQIRKRYRAPMKSVITGDPYFTSGIQGGVDKVVIQFHGSTNAPGINAGNITTLALSSGSWLDTGSQINSAVWSTTAYTNDTLTVTLSDNGGSGPPTIAKGANITLSSGSLIKDVYGNDISDTVTLRGDFELNLPEGAVAYWRFDESSGNPVDSVGQHASTRNATWQPTGGKFKGDLYFGAGHQVQVTNTSDINPDRITVEAWVKNHSSYSYWYRDNSLVSKRDAYILATVQSSQQVRFYVYVDGNWRYTSYTPSNITNWHHYVGTYDGKSIQLYFDGQPVGTPNISYPGEVSVWDTGDLFIGRDDGNSEYLYGYMDDVVIYDRALTADEVFQRFGDPFVFGRARDYSNGGKDIQTNDRVAITFASSTNAVPIDKDNIDSLLPLSGPHTWKDNVGGGITSADWSSATYSNDTLTITLKNTDAAGDPDVDIMDIISFDGKIGTTYRAFEKTSTSVTLDAYIYGSFGENLLSGARAFWQMDENQGTVAYDSYYTSTIPAYDADLKNAPTWNGTSMFGPGLYFGGSDDYLDVGSIDLSGLGTNGEWTVESWFKIPLPNTGNDRTLFENAGSHRMVVVDSSGILGTDDGTFRSSTFDTASLADGWHQVIAVGGEGGAQTKFYVDGQSAGTTVSFQSTQALTSVGNIAAGDQQFGNIDNVVVYDVALTAAQVEGRYLVFLNEAFARDSSWQGAGPQAKDQVVLTFDGPTNGDFIDKNNIDTALALNNSHTWLDGNGDIDSAIWSSVSSSNDRLTITLNAVTALKPNVVVGDQVSLSGSVGVIKDRSGKLIDSSLKPPGYITISGDFGINLPDDAIAYWNFNAGTYSGATVYDQFNDNNGTLYGGSYGSNISSGIIDSGVWHKSRYGRLTVSDSSELNPTNITVEAWAKSSPETWQNNASLVSKSSAYTFNVSAGTKTVTFRVYAGGSWRDVSHTLSNITNWHHYVGTYDGANVKIYVDGEQKSFTGCGACGKMNTTDTGGLYLGKTIGTGQYNSLNGWMDEVALYKRALTPSEISARYALGGIESAVAYGTGGGGEGIHVDDQIVVSFIGETNGILIDKDNIESTLDISSPLGHTWLDGAGAIGSAVWSNSTFTNDILTVKLSTGTSAPTVGIGDTITLGGAITNTRGAPIDDSIDISGTFGSAVKISSAVASDDSGGGNGVQAGDKVKIIFDGETQGNAIDETNITTALALNNSHTWLDGSGSLASTVPAWSDATYSNNTLTITLNDSTSAPDIEKADIISVDVVTIKDQYGNPVLGTTPIGGTFGYGSGNPPPSGMIAYWDFEEKAGTVAYDNSSNHNDGTLAGTVPIPSWEANGRVGRALSFDGNDYVTTPVTGFNVANAFTAEMWIKIGSGGTSRILNYGANSSSRGGWILGVDPDGTLRTYTDANCYGSWQLLNSNAKVDDNRWHHIALTYDSSSSPKRKIYVDGALDNSDSPGYCKTPGNDFSTAIFSIGRSSYTSDEYEAGIFDEIVIYDRALTPAEILGRSGTLLLSATADANSGWGPGVQSGDRVTILFSSSTNAALVNAGNIDSALDLGGNSWLDGNNAITSAAWSATTVTNDTLTVTLAGHYEVSDALNTSVVQPTILAGDTITIDSTSVIKGSSGGDITHSASIAGNFGSASGVGFLTAFAGDDDGLYAKQAGDTVTIQFDGPIYGVNRTVPPVIDKDTINTALNLGGNTWLDNLSDIGTAVWSKTTYTNDTLVITLSEGGGQLPSVDVGDTITLGGSYVRDKYLNDIVDSATIGGAYNLPSSAIAWWKFNGSGSSVPNDLGPGYAGTKSIEASRASGISGTTGMYFEGTSDYVSLDAKVVDLTNTEWTIEAWFKLPFNDPVGGQQKYTLVAESGSSHNQILVDTQTIKALGTSNGGTYYFVPAEILDYNLYKAGTGWHQVVAVGSGGDLTAGTTTFYMDGHLVGQAKSSDGLDTFKSNLNIKYIGNKNGGGRPFGTTVDDVIVYDSALSAEVIERRYGAYPRTAFAYDTSNGGAGIQAGDQVLIRFDGSTNGVAIDKNNINAALDLTGSNTWLDGSGNIGTAVWSTYTYTNDSLTITLSGSGSPPVAVTNTITLSSSSVIKAYDGKDIEDSVTLQGDFGLNLPVGTIAYWAFDENVASPATDEPFYDKMGSNTGTLPVYAGKQAGWVTGMYGTSGIKTDELNEILWLDSPLFFPREWTIMSWFKYPVTGGTQAVLTHGNVHEHQVTVNTQGSTDDLGVFDAVGTSTFYDTGYNMTDLTQDWHHLAAVGSGGNGNMGTTKFYVDGQYVGEAVGNGKTYKSYQNIKFIGDDEPRAKPFGEYDELIVVDQALTLSQIRDYYGATLKTAYANDYSGGKFGVDAGDQIVLTFDGATNGPSIHAGNITTVLALSYGHSWLDGNSAIGSAEWSGKTYSNDTLTVSLSIGGGAPTVALKDIITLDGVTIRDASRAIQGTVSISGDFDGAIAMWDLDDGAGTKAADSIGGNDGTLYGDNGDPPGWATGYFGNALLFDDTSKNYVSVPDSDTFNLKDYTIEAWIRIPHNMPTGGGFYPQKNMRIVSQEDDNNATNYWNFFINTDGIDVDNSGTVDSDEKGLLGHCDSKSNLPTIVNTTPEVKLRIGGLAAATRGKCGVVTSQTLNDDSWHHVVVVRDTATGVFRWYIDGTNVKTSGANTSGTDTHSINDNIDTLPVTGKVEIGRKYGWQYLVPTGGSPPADEEHFRGNIDNVVIYDYALADSEVQSHYFVFARSATAKDDSTPGMAGIQAGDQVVILFNGVTAGATTIINAGNIDAVLALSGGHTWKDGSNNAIGGAAWSKTYKDYDTLTITLNDVTGSKPDVKKGDKITFDGTILDNANNTITGSIVIGGTFEADVPVGVVAYWNFDENASSFAADLVGSYSGTNPVTPSWITGKFGSGLNFTSTPKDSIVPTTPVPLAGIWTIEAWFKPPFPDNLSQRWSLAFYNSQNHHIMIMDPNNGTNYELGTYYFGAGDTFFSTGYSMTTIMNEGTPTWHHLVAVGKDGKTIFYIDGAQKGSPADYQTTEDVKRIGNGEDTQAEIINGFGNVDDVLIYNRALTTSEISDRYNKYK